MFRGYHLDISGTNVKLLHIGRNTLSPIGKKVDAIQACHSHTDDTVGRCNKISCNIWVLNSAR
jgi:hypothetical protein